MCCSCEAQYQSGDTCREDRRINLIEMIKFDHAKSRGYHTEKTFDHNPPSEKKRKKKREAENRKADANRDPEFKLVERLIRAVVVYYSSAVQTSPGTKRAANSVDQKKDEKRKNSISECVFRMLLPGIPCKNSELFPPMHARAFPCPFHRTQTWHQDGIFAKARDPERKKKDSS